MRVAAPSMCYTSRCRGDELSIGTVLPLIYTCVERVVKLVVRDSIVLRLIFMFRNARYV